MTEHINWYPGHMKKTERLIVENIKKVDVVVELIDARIPVSSRNPALGEMIGDKEKILLLNKRDLADEKESEKWLESFRCRGEEPLPINANEGKGIGELVESLQEKKRKRTGRRSSLPFRVMIVGIPNVGKSSLINRLTGKKSTQTGNRPGVTKGKQWLTIPGEMQLLDTPGILWPKIEEAKVGLNLAFCGSIKDEILDRETLALELIKSLEASYPELLKERYKLKEIRNEPLETMEAIGTGRGFLKKGGLVDYTRTAETLLDEFRKGRIGRISLEKVDEYG